MEEEFIRNQERLKPQEEKIEEERSKVSSVCRLTNKLLIYDDVCEIIVLKI